MTMTHDTAAAARPPRIVDRLMDAAGRLVRELAHRAERKAQMRALRDLNDHLLRDIGITRQQAEEQIRRYG